MDLGISGLASGFDWRSLVDQLADVERAPQRSLQTQQTKLQERNNAYGSVKTELNILRNRVTALKDPTLFDSRTASSSNTALGTASVTAGANVGNFAFTIDQLATTSSQQGQANVGRRLSDTNDVSGVVLGSAGFATPVSEGTFTVNGKQVSVVTTDTLQGVFDKIATATGNDVIGTYDKDTDQITLTGSAGVVLGSATDTSNFLLATKLHSNQSGPAVSSDKLGAVKMTGILSDANLATPLTAGTDNKGEFSINGVSITYDTSADSMTNLIARINASSAGVLASYDSVNDRFSLTNKSTGDMGIALEDKTGNFLAATGLSGGTLTVGQNLHYSVNGGGQLSSRSNTITGESSGLQNLSVTALDEGTFTVTVGADTSKMRKSITDFVEEYNKVQSLINTQTASSTDAQGKVTAGTLAADPEANELVTRLRGLMTSSVSGLSGSISRLEGLGFSSNGYDDALSTSDLTHLDDALSGNLAAVKDFFTNTTSGLAVSLDSYLEKTIGEEGTLVKHQDALTDEVGDMDTQIADLEKLVQTNRQTMIDSFVAMEQAQQKINDQLTYLNKTFNS